MEIILGNNCCSLTGTLGQGYGYYIRHNRANRFFGQRSKGYVPPDGHLRFIIACAELAKCGLHITGIRVPAKELREACREAQQFIAARQVNLATYNAQDIINFKHSFSL